MRNNSPRTKHSRLFCTKIVEAADELSAGTFIATGNDSTGAYFGINHKKFISATCSGIYGDAPPLQFGLRDRAALNNRTDLNYRVVRPIKIKFVVTAMRHRQNYRFQKSTKGVYK